MRKSFFFLCLALFTASSYAQVIKRGNPSRNVYIRVEDTTAQKPFEFRKQSMLSISVYDLLFTNVTLKYEFFRADGKMGYQLPISINTGGLPDTSNYSVNNRGRFLSDRNRIFQTGFGLNYYTSGQDKTSYYIGFNLQAGWFYYWHYSYATVPSPYGPYTAYVSNEKMIGNNLAGLLHAGILFNPKENITFNLRGGIGLRRYSTIMQEYTFSTVQVDACLGFKF